MSTIGVERVTGVRHWNSSLFSLTTTRDSSFRFENGQFVMMGLQLPERPLLRAYSIASASHEEQLEFFSIKVADGLLTSRLKDIQVGDPVLVSRKATGTLVLRDLKPGKRLFLLSTGTGLAPFLSLVKDSSLYEQFELIVLAHGVRTIGDLAYSEYLTNELPNDAFLGECVCERFRYYPAVTREPFRHQGRITELLRSGRLFDDLQISPIDTSEDRAMVCGSVAVIDEVSSLLEELGFVASPRIGEPGDYLIERAFVDR